MVGTESDVLLFAETLVLGSHTLDAGRETFGWIGVALFRGVFREKL